MQMQIKKKCQKQTANREKREQSVLKISKILSLAWNSGIVYRLKLYQSIKKRKEMG